MMIVFLKVVFVAMLLTIAGMPVSQHGFLPANHQKQGR
jgi:hypothetical protein